MPVEQVRECNMCRRVTPLSGMKKNGTKASGRRRWGTRCAPCSATQARQWYADNKEYANAAAQVRAYGITVEDYAELMRAQGGGCAICFTIENSGHRLCVDHNHSTGAIRGLLCHGCNRGLGLLQDDPDVLARAITYIERY